MLRVAHLCLFRAVLRQCCAQAYETVAQCARKTAAFCALLLCLRSPKICRMRRAVSLSSEQQPRDDAVARSCRRAATAQRAGSRHAYAAERVRVRSSSRHARAQSVTGVPASARRVQQPRAMRHAQRRRAARMRRVRYAEVYVVTDTTRRGASLCTASLRKSASRCGRRRVRGPSRVAVRRQGPRERGKMSAILL